MGRHDGIVKAEERKRKRKRRGEEREKKRKRPPALFRASLSKILNVL